MKTIQPKSHLRACQYALAILNARARARANDWEGFSGKVYMLSLELRLRRALDAELALRPATVVFH